MSKWPVKTCFAIKRMVAFDLKVSARGNGADHFDKYFPPTIFTFLAVGDCTKSTLMKKL